MANMEIKIEVAKETYEFGQAIGAVVASAQLALADGWQPGQDIPAVIMAVAGQLLPAIQGLEKLGDEAKEDPASFAKALAVSMSDVLAAVLKK